MPVLPAGSSIHEAFEKDIKNRHLVYDYAVPGSQTASGKGEKWRYEMWFHSEDRIVYMIHGGPMAPRSNYQAATYQCIRPGELWQCNWLEETGTLCSLVFDIPNAKITTMLGFSKGHWEEAVAAHGDKRNQADFDRWRGLAKLGSQVERTMLCEQAEIKEDFYGGGSLGEIDVKWATL